MRREWPGRARVALSAWWTQVRTTPLERPPVRTTLIQLGASSVAAGIAALLGHWILFAGFAYGAAVVMTYLPPFPYRNGRRSFAALVFLLAAGFPIFWTGTAIRR